MKRSIWYFVLSASALGVYILAGALSCCILSKCNKSKTSLVKEKVITHQCTDERGLTSVLFYYSDKPTDTFAYDYLNEKEYDSIFSGHTYETDDTRFDDYEILYPDYAHLDTLIVVNADSLNWCMENYDIATDGDIYDVLHAFCVPVNSILRKAWISATMPDNSIDMAILNDAVKELIIDNYLMNPKSEFYKPL